MKQIYNLTLLTVFVVFFRTTGAGQTLTPSSTSYCEGTAGITFSVENSVANNSYTLQKQISTNWNDLQTITSVSGGTIYFTGFFKQANYRLKYTTSVVLITEISLPENIYSITGGGHYCLNSTTYPALGLSGSQSYSGSGVLYKLYRNNVWYNNLQMNGTGSALVFGTFSSPGTYTIRAERGGCQRNMNGNKIIDTSLVPVAGIISNVLAPPDSCGYVAFTPVISYTPPVPAPPYQYAWNFGAGSVPSSSNLMKPVSQFPAYGTAIQTFPVILMVTDTNGCSGSDTVNVTVPQRPDALVAPLNGIWSNCNADPQATFALTIINRSTTATSNTGYIIDWGDSNPPAPVTLTPSQFPYDGQLTHTYTSKGTFYLKVTATGPGPNNCDGTKIYPVFNGSNPSGGIQYSQGSLQGCKPHTITFKLSGTAQNNAPTTFYYFDFGDGTPVYTFTQENMPPLQPDGSYHITHTYNSVSCNMPGNSFTLTHYIENPCSVVPNNVGGIKISQKSSAGFLSLEFPEDPIYVCAGVPKTYTNNASPGCIIYGNGVFSATNYYWDFNNDGIFEVTGENPSYTYADTGLYYVTQKAYTGEAIPGNCGPDMLTRPVCSQGIPQTNFNMTESFCTGEEINITNMTTVEPSCALLYNKWVITPATGFSFINGTSSTSADPVLKFTNSGIYTVKLVAWVNSGGTICNKDSMQVQVTVVGQPYVSLSQPSQSICGPDTLAMADYVTYHASQGVISGYTWSVSPAGPVISDIHAPFPTVIFPDDITQNFVLTVSVANQCGTLNSPPFTVIETKTVSNNFAGYAGINVLCDGMSLTQPITGSMPSGGTLVYNYSWYIDEGSGWTLINGAINQNLQYNNPLHHDPTRFKRKVTSGGCISESNIVTINLIPGIQNNIITQSQSICLGSPAASLNGSLPTNGSGSYTYLWQQCDDSPAFTNWIPAIGTNNTQNFTPGLLNQTTQYRRIVYSGSCELTSNTVEITINGIPQITSPATAQACSMVPLNYGITSNVEGTHYSWVVNDLSGGAVTGYHNYGGGNAVIINDTLVNSSTTDKTIQYLITPVGPLPSLCPGNSFLLTVTVHPKMNSTYHNKIINTGTYTNLDGIITGGTAPYSYSWAPPEMLVTGQNLQPNPQTVILNLPQTYCLTVTDANGCPFFQCITITTTGTGMSVSLSCNDPDLIICNGETITLTATASGGAGGSIPANYTYTWNGLPPIVSHPQPWISTFTPVTTGTNGYSVTVGDGFTTASDNLTLTVNQIPVINSTLSRTICSGQNVGYVPSSNVPNSTFQWTRGINPCITSVQTNSTGTGTINNILNNSCSSPQIITYTIIPTGPAPTFCQGPASTLDVEVMPVAAITNNVLSQNVVSGQSTSPVIFTSNVTGAGFYWEFTSLTCTGFFGSYLANGDSSLLPTQVLSILPGGPSTCTLTYKITAYTVLPDGTKCWGTPVFYNFVVNSEPARYYLQCPGPVCEGNPVSITLDNSDVGVDYQLLESSLPVIGGLKPGTGSPLTWPITASGTYTVLATNITNQQSVLMYGLCNVAINSNPVSNFVIGSTGNCAGDHITLNGSEESVLYELFIGTTNTLVSRTGPGPLDFGPQSNAGIYRIRATKILSGCSLWIDGSITLMPLPQQFLFSPAGNLCTGDELFLAGSESGILYSLICTPLNGSVFTQGPWPGNGQPLNFGNQSVPGSYQVQAFNPVTGCDVLFTDIKTILPAAVPYNVTPAQPQCGLTQIGLDNSQTGFTYRVHQVDPVSGNPYILPDPNFPLKQGVTGQALIFGTTSLPAIYCVIASNASNLCSNEMNGRVVVLTSPTPFQMIPTGNVCMNPSVGTEIKLEHSEAGIYYTLFLAGSSWSSTVIGTGGTGTLSFGLIAVPGTYTIMASDQNGNCQTPMLGTLNLQPEPSVFILNPSGTACPGTSIWLNGSQTGVSYHLHIPSGGFIALAGNGQMLNWGPFYQPGKYFVTAHSLSSGCSRTMTDTVTISTHPNVYSAKPQGANCEPQDIGMENAQAGITYEIVHQDGSSLAVPVLFTPASPGSFWFNAPQPYGIYRVKAYSAENCDTLMNGIVEIDPKPSADAGPPEVTLCNLPPFSINLSGTATNYSEILWTSPTNPSGSNFSNPTALETVYTFTPADLQNKQVTLTIHATGLNGCFTRVATDTIRIRILAPIVSAGPDQSVCANENVYLNGTVSGITTTGVWSGGAGVFYPNRQTLNAIYVPAASETGSVVVLSLTSTQQSGACPNVADEMSITIFAPVQAGQVLSDEYVCYNQVPGTLSATSPSGGSGNFAFQWQKINSGNWTDITGETNQSYTPPALTSNAQYRVMQVDQHCYPNQIVYTNPVTVTVYTPLSPGNVLSSQSVCFGEAPQPLNVTLPGGGSGQNSYQWQQKPGTGDWMDITGATSLTYSPPPLTVTTQYRVIQRDNFCNPVLEVVTNPLTITVFGQLVSGMATQDQMICYGTVPTALQVAQPAGGSGSYHYQWQLQNSTGNWTNIPFANTPVYAPPALFATAKYRVITTDYTCNPDQQTVSNTITIAVYEQFSAGTAGYDQTICYNEIPNPLNVSFPAGGSGNYHLQWQSDTGTGWNDLTGASAISYSPPSLTSTTQYRVKVADEFCNPVQISYSNIVTINVRGALQTGSLSQNQVICYGEVPDALHVSAPAGGSGNISYLWQSKTPAGGWTNITSGTSTTYSPPALNVTTQYRVVQTDLSCISLQQVTSNIVTVSVYEMLTTGLASSDQVLCNGENPSPLSLTQPSGGSGNYSYQWQFEVGSGGWTNIAGANVQNYSPGHLTVTTKYRVIQQDIYCDPPQQVTSNEVTITVFDILVSGSVTENQTICYGQSPLALIASVPQGGSGNYVYQWQSKIAGGNWLNIQDAIDLAYLPDPLTETTQFRIVVTDQGCGTTQTVFSNSVTITVYSSLVPGVVSSSQSICYGEKPAALTATVPTGGSGNFTYQWQVMIGTGGWTNITGANQLTFSPPNLSLTTSYRLLQRDTYCFPIQEKITNVVTITVYNHLQPGSASNSQVLCQGQTSQNIYATPPTGGSGSFEYQWQFQVGASGWFDIPFANSLIYNPGILTQTTSFRVIQTDVYCNPDQFVITNVVTITVYSELVSGVVSESQDICYRTIPQPLHSTVPSGGSGEFSLQWQRKTGTGFWTDIAGANGLIYAPPLMTQTCKFRLVQSDGYCDPPQQVVSNEITVTVFDTLVSGNASADQTICRGETPATLHLSQTSGGSGLFRYQWQVQLGSTVWNNIPGATTTVFSPPALYQTTRYRVVQKDDHCEPAQETISAAVTITVYDLFTTGLLGTDQTICYGERPQIMTLSSPGGGSGNYTYQWQSQSGTGSWTDIPGANGTSYQPLPLTSTMHYRVIQSDVFCMPVQVLTSNPITISVYNQLVAGIAWDGQTICYGETPQILTAQPPSGGSSYFNYNWQVLNGFGNWLNINGATSLTYAPPPLFATTQYRIAQTDAYCNPGQVVYSNAAKITVYNEFLPGTTASDQVLCMYETPAPLTATLPSGGSGNPHFQWQSSVSAGIWTDILNATFLTYSPPMLNQTTQFRLKQTDTFCNPDDEVYTPPVTLTVIPTPTPTLNGPSLVCINSSGNHYQTEPGKQNYEWSVTGGIVTSGGGVNDYEIIVTWNTIGQGMVSVNYHEPVHNCEAGSPVTFPVNVVVPPVPVIVSSPPGATVGCVDQCITFETEAGMTNYTWNVSPGGQICSLGQTTDRRIVVKWTAAGSHWVSVNYTGAAGCAANLATVYSITIIPAPTPTISGPNAICLTGQIHTYITEAGMNGYQWTVSTGGTIAGGLGTNHLNVIWNSTGTHSATVSYTNIFGCSAVNPTAFPVSVTPLPVPLITGNTTACIGSANNVYLTDPGNSGYTWIISSGGQIVSGGGTSDNTVTVQWNNSGIQSVSVSYTNPDGCQPVIPSNLTVFVQPTPVPVINGPAVVCKGSSTNSYATQTGMTNYNWTISSGGQITSGTGTSTIIVHWFTAGNQTVSVNYVNTSGCTGSSSTTLNVLVSSQPVASFRSDTVCLGTPTTFTNLSSAVTGQITNYLWEFGDGQTATTANPQHSYFTSGIYAVRLMVTNTAGCVKDTISWAQVWAKPNALFNVSANNCAGDSVQFTDYSSTGHGYISEWIWEFGDGTPPVPIPFPQNPNIKHKFNNGGNYNVKLTINTSDGCTSFKINTVNVAFRPLANFTSAGSPCADMPLQFTDLSQLNGGPPITAWSWDFDDPASGTANFSNVQNPQHVFTAGNNYYVRLQVINANGCLDSISKQFIVHDHPLASFTTDSSCITAPTQFHDGSTTTQGTILTWNWNFGDPSSGTSNNSTLQNPVHIYNIPGSYWVTLEVTNSYLCVHDTSVLITTYPKPIAGFSASTSCMQDVTSFTDLSIAPNSSIQSWNWDFGDGGTATIQNPTHIYLTAGTFNVKLIVKNLLGCSDSVVIPVVVRYKPSAAYWFESKFCPGKTVFFHDSSSAYGGAAVLSRQWFFEPGATSNLVNPVHTFPQGNMDYSVTLMVSDTYGCRDTIVDTVFVKPPYDLTFQYDTACFGDITHFRAVNLAQGDELYSIFWDFGDPASGPANYSYDSLTTHVFSGTGNFIVRLRATDSDNCLDSIAKIISVRKLPEPDFLYNSAICNDTIWVSDKSKPGYGDIIQWKWIWGDGSSPVVITPPLSGDTSHVYPGPGNYMITLIVTNEHGCIDTTIKPVTVNCITAGFTQANAFNCSSDSIGFADHSTPVTNINSWKWNFGDGTLLNYVTFVDTVYHKFPPGNYHITLTVTNGTGTSAVNSVYSRDITVHAAPIAAFSHDAVCYGDSIHYIDLAQDNQVPIISREWWYGDNKDTVFVDTAVNPVHKFPKAGKFKTKFLVRNNIGCRDSIIKTITVFRLPVAKIAGSALCQRYNIVLHDSSLVGDSAISQWFWVFNNPDKPYDTLKTQTVHQRFDSIGKYDVYYKVVDKNGCADDTIFTNFEIMPSPVAAFTITENMDGKPGKIRLNNLSEGSSDKAWKWDYETGKSTEKNPVVTFTDDSRVYNIRLVTWNDDNCYDTTKMVYSFIYDQLYVPNAFSPVSYVLDIREFKPKGMNLKDYHIIIFDKWGHLLWESTLLQDGRPAEGWDGTFKGEPMPQDVYFWKISAVFNNNKVWEGSDSGTGSVSTFGSVTLIK